MFLENKNIAVILFCISVCTVLITMVHLILSKHFYSKKNKQNEILKAKQAPYKKDPDFPNGRIFISQNSYADATPENLVEIRTANLIANQLMQSDFSKIFTPKSYIDPILKSLEKQINYNPKDIRFKLNG